MKKLEIVEMQNVEGGIGPVAAGLIFLGAGAMGALELYGLVRLIDYVA